MGDKLKQFIDDNREEFDSEMPRQRLLHRLKKQPGHNTGSARSFRWSYLYRAAAVVVIIILSIVLYYSLQRKNGSGMASSGPEPVEEKAIITDPVYAKQIDQYRDLISLQQTELRKIGKEQPELYRQFERDVNQLDSAYRILKTILTNNPNREMLLEAMISNLQLQTDLLNRQLLIIKEIKQKSKAHEKSSV